MKLSIAIYGTGRASLGFYRFLKKSPHEVTGFITTNEQRAKEFSAEQNIPCFTSLDALMAASPQTNMALIANANDQHAPCCIEALRKNLHVYCEKPMAPTLEESRQMLDAERNSKGSLQIGFEYIHSTMPRRLTELKQDGFFGELLSASFLDSRGHWWSGDPAAPFEQQVKLRREVGGGIVFHCGIHQLDMMRAYLGEFCEVTAYRSRKNALPFYPVDVPDHVQVMLRGVDGKIGSLEIFHNRAPTYYRRNPAYVPHWPSVPGHEFKLSLVGTEASCLADFYGEKIHLFRFDHTIKDTELLRTEDFAFHPHNELHHDMNGFLERYLSNVAAGKGPLTPATDAYKTMELAFAVEESISANKTVTL